MMEIETKNASLDTLAVTIQALHVSGKQMTLAVFRQLPIAKVLNDDGTLANLDFWGLVRYHIKDESDLWAIGSFNGNLYRCDAIPWAISVKHAQYSEKEARIELQKYRAWESQHKAYEAWKAAPKETRGHPPEYSWARNEVGLERAYIDEVKRRITAVETASKAEVSLSILAALPQLFIAV
jgi:hypothetical protein